MLVQAAERLWSPAAVHDSVRAVLRDPAFRRSLKQSLFDRLLLWIVEWYRRLERALSHLPSTRSLGLFAIGLVVLFVVARTIISARARAEDSARFGRKRTITAHEDPWNAADALAASGHFDVAAHALYRGVLLFIERSDHIRLDPSRTSGDYVRELRRRSSPSVERFRGFTRRFELAVYGHEPCTAAVYDELRLLSDAFRQRARAA
jgi:Domain of unknown function (DUF4129)